MGGEGQASAIVDGGCRKDDDGCLSDSRSDLDLQLSESLTDDIEHWTCEDVSVWLESIGLGDYCNLLCSTHRIDGNVLLSLHEKDLKEPPLAMDVLGDIKRLNKAVKGLRQYRDTAATPDGAPPMYFTPIPRRFRRSSSGGDDFFIDGPVTLSPNTRHMGRATVPDSTSPRKAIATLVYVWMVFLLTSFTMTIVHSRVPDMTTYRPLPDIALDNIPHIPWAFEVSEAIGVFFVALYLLTLLFHKHRLLIFCRLNILLGTVFLLRCCTMFVTSLSVPGNHLHCKPVKFETIQEMMWRAFEITSGFGMSLTGVHTCGDYMFSGHTVVLTMLNLAITEYTPRRWRTLHVLTWVMNIFGIFFILAAHEHYSIDVVIAFVITSRLFLYYHALANSRALMAGDNHRLREWFPMFTYVEEGWSGDRLSNVYRNPFEDLRKYISVRFAGASDTDSGINRKTTPYKRKRP